MLTKFVQKMFDGQQWHQQVKLTVCDGKITDIQTNCGTQHQYEAGCIVPGFIDVQVNGGGGKLLNHYPTLDGIETIFRAHHQFGTTALLPTLITDEISVMEQAADAISAAIKAKSAGILGVHFEGPHISVEKKGAHNQDFIRPISDAEWAIFERDDLGVKQITIAPENVSDEEIKRLVAAGCIVSLGHTNCNYQRAMEAIAAGATGVTHLYNAMSAMESRAPGVVGASINGNTYCGVIMDGYHVDPACVELAANAKHQGKLMLVTDAMGLVGSDETSFTLMGKTVNRIGDKLVAETGELAGSALDMWSAILFTVQKTNISFEEALRMAATYPAEFLGLAQQKGALKVDFDADWVHVDGDRLKSVCQQGIENIIS